MYKHAVIFNVKYLKAKVKYGGVNSMYGVVGPDPLIITLNNYRSVID